MTQAERFVAEMQAALVAEAAEAGGVIAIDPAWLQTIVRQVQGLSDAEFLAWRAAQVARAAARSEVEYVPARPGWRDRVDAINRRIFGEPGFPVE